MVVALGSGRFAKPVWFTLSLMVFTLVPGALPFLKVAAACTLAVGSKRIHLIQVNLMPGANTTLG